MSSFQELYRLRYKALLLKFRLFFVANGELRDEARVAIEMLPRDTLLKVSELSKNESFVALVNLLAVRMRSKNQDMDDYPEQLYRLIDTIKKTLED